MDGFRRGDMSLLTLRGAAYQPAPPLSVAWTIYLALCRAVRRAELLECMPSSRPPLRQQMLRHLCMEVGHEFWRSSSNDIRAWFAAVQHVYIQS